MTIIITLIMMTMTTMCLLLSWSFKIIGIVYIIIFGHHPLSQNIDSRNRPYDNPSLQCIVCVGSLFQSCQEWLHFAFPNECPYPHMVEEAKALTPSHWFDKKMSVEPGQRIHLASAAEEETTETASGVSSEITWASKDAVPALHWRSVGYHMTNPWKKPIFSHIFPDQSLKETNIFPYLPIFSHDQI